MVYEPDEARADQYDELLELYRHLHDLFGREDSTMRQLKAIRRRAMGVE